MKNTALFGVLGLFVALFVFYGYETYRLRKKAKNRLKEIEWSMSELGRALSLIEKNDTDSIFTGLHILSAINHPSRLKALPRLVELTQHENASVVNSVKSVIDKMVDSSPSYRSAKDKTYASSLIN